MPASDDTIEYTVWEVYVGESLHGAAEPPMNIVLDPETLYGLERAIPVYWGAVLQVIETKLRRRAT